MMLVCFIKFLLPTVLSAAHKDLDLSVDPESSAISKLSDCLFRPGEKFHSLTVRHELIVTAVDMVDLGTCYNSPLSPH